MHLHVQLIARLEMRQFHQRGVEDDALRIADLGDRFNHAVILCLTAWPVKRAANGGARARGSMALPTRAAACERLPPASMEPSRHGPRSGAAPGRQVEICVSAGPRCDLLRIQI